MNNLLAGTTLKVLHRNFENVSKFRRKKILSPLPCLEPNVIHIIDIKKYFLIKFLFHHVYWNSIESCLRPGRMAHIYFPVFPWILGAKVILACRDIVKAQKAAEEIRTITRSDRIVVRKLDLASLASVKAFAQVILQEEDRLDILINNAGRTAPFTFITLFSSFSLLLHLLFF